MLVTTRAITKLAASMIDWDEPIDLARQAIKHQIQISWLRAAVAPFGRRQMVEQADFELQGTVVVTQHKHDGVSTETYRALCSHICSSRQAQLTLVIAAPHEQEAVTC